MLDTKDLSVALGLMEPLYRTVEDPAAWPEFLTGMAEGLGSVIPGLAKGGERPSAFAVDADPKWIREFEEHFASRIETWAHASSTYGTWSYADIDSEVLDELVYDWAHPMGVDNSLTAHLMVDGVLAGFGVYREIGGLPFDGRDRAFLELLAPHVAGALLLADRVRKNDPKQSLASAALDQSTAAVFLVDREGEVREANTMARRVAARGDGLSVRQGKIELVDRIAGGRLRQLIARAATTTQRTGLAAGGIIRAPRPSRKRAYELLVTPLPQGGVRLGANRWAYASIHIADPEASPDSLASRFCDLFGLTPAEGRLAHHLVEGFDLEEIADRVGVSRETLRNQLKSVFQKTDCRRQAQLVAVLLRGVANRVDDPR